MVHMVHRVHRVHHMEYINHVIHIEPTPTAQRGEQFARTSTAARQTISEIGERFIHMGMRILVHGYSRVVLALLKQAKAQVGMGGAHMRHIVILLQCYCVIVALLLRYYCDVIAILWDGWMDMCARLSCSKSSHTHTHTHTHTHKHKHKDTHPLIPPHTYTYAYTLQHPSSCKQTG